MQATAAVTTQPAGTVRLVRVDAAIIEASWPTTAAEASRHLGATVPESWPEAELRSALPVHLDRLRLGGDAAQWGVRAIVVDGELRGSVGFKGGPGPDGAVEVGYGVVPEARGAGLATLAVATLVEWALRQRGVRRVRATIAPANMPSQAVARRAGLRHVGEMADREHGVLEVWELGWLRQRVRR